MGVGCPLERTVAGAALWIFTGVAWATIVVQVVLGVLLSNRDLEAPEFHKFYGFVAMISAALIYSYRAQIKDHRYLLYGSAASSSWAWAYVPSTWPNGSSQARSRSGAAPTTVSFGGAGLC